MIVEATVAFVVVDDLSASERIEDLFQPAGLSIASFRGGAGISSGLVPMHLVASVDVRLPGISGLELSKVPDGNQPSWHIVAGRPEYLLN